ncbi:MAG TPA: gephyrin-like molybdotransferase Glp [Thermoanaerobaculia bacterium]|nr:gephyrin-like molybdotransferase Glp [Thermoanaerobaculia bacterium]
MRPFASATEPPLPVDEAVARVLAEIHPLESESVPLDASLGRVLRQEVVAPFDVPPHDNSAMDGYAVLAGDTAAAPARLRVIEDLAAGRTSTRSVESGTAVRIMTGAAIPAGADAVAPVEITDAGSETVTIHRSIAPGANVRLRGDDMQAGATVLPAGVRLGAAELAVAAAARQARLVVGRRPAVAILATGDELSRVSEKSDGSRTVDSNSYALAALVAEAGAVARQSPIVRDTREATVAAIEQVLDCDFILTTGGVSVGAYDFVKDAVERLGGRTHFWRVAMKPGKPVLFASLRNRLFFGLPGNPVSAMVSFAVFVAPAIRKALGESSVTAPLVRIRTGARLQGAGDRRAYLRVRVVARDGELIAEPMRAQGSHIATSMVGANGLAIVDGDAVEAGDLVPVMMLGPITAST